MDPVLQAYTGLMAENAGHDGIPHRVPIIAIDMSTAIYAFTAVSAALFARQNEPRGRHIEASLMQAAASLQVVRMMGSYLDGGTMRPISPPSGVYQTADGWMQITVVRLFEWEAYCKAFDLPDFAADERFRTSDGRTTHAAELDGVLRPLLRSRPTAYWSERLSAHRVMHESLNTYGDFLKQPHVAASEAVAWLDHPQVPQPLPMVNLIGLPTFESGTPRALSPTKGEHGAAILAEHGYAAAQIAALRDSGVLVGA